MKEIEGNVKPKWNGKDYLRDQIYGRIDLSNKGLTKLPADFYDTENIERFWIRDNKLKSIIGSPKSVIYNFGCGNNLLTNLIGAPERIGGAFSCSDNPELISLEGAPKEVGGGFWVTGCPKLFNISNIVNIKIGGNIHYDSGYRGRTPINIILNKYKNRPQDRFKLVKELQQIDERFK